MPVEQRTFISLKVKSVAVSGNFFSVSITFPLIFKLNEAEMLKAPLVFILMEIIFLLLKSVVDNNKVLYGFFFFFFWCPWVSLP